MNSDTLATYWKNGEPVYLKQDKSAYANSIFVSGSDVYVAGAEQINGTDVALYWKNGVIHYLGDTTVSSVASQIFVSGNDVYVSGTIYNNGTYTSVYWKNGLMETLATNYDGHSLYVSGSDVYVTGFENAPLPVGKYWKNGIENTLQEAGYSYSIFVSGNDVYVAGIGLGKAYPYGNYATIWKNGVPTHLSQVNSFAYSVFVK